MSMLSFSTYLLLQIQIAYDWLFLSHEYAVADSQVFDEVVIRVEIKLNLEVATSVLLGCLRVLVRDHKVVNDPLLKWLSQRQLTMVVCSWSRLV